MEQKCFKCGHEAERAIHSLTDFGIARKALDFCNFPHLVMRFSGLNAIDWIEVVVDLIETEEIDKFLMMAWALWNTRNDELINNRKQDGE